MFSSRIANSRTRVKLYSQKATLMNRSHTFDGPISGLPAAKCVRGFIFIQASPFILCFKAIHDLQKVLQSFSYSDCPLSNPCSAIWIYQATNKMGGITFPPSAYPRVVLLVRAHSLEVGRQRHMPPYIARLLV